MKPYYEVAPVRDLGSAEAFVSDGAVYALTSEQRDELRRMARAQKLKTCCLRHLEESTESWPHLEMWQARSRMMLCSDCGNKRCPRATDCGLACTGSNEPNQPGSVYQYRPFTREPDTKEHQ